MLSKKDAPTSFITFSGLSFFYFNKAKKRGEITFIHLGDHKLQIEMFRQSNEKGGELIPLTIAGERRELQEININEMLKSHKFSSKGSLSEVNITISGSKESPTSDLFQPAENFKRQNPSDENDISWLPTMEEIHGAKLQLKPAAERANIKISKLIINNAEFYTEELPKPLYVKKTDGQESKFGRIANTIGARIESNRINFTITKKGKKYRKTLLNTDENPVFIKITNDGEGGSDLEHYYKFFAVEDEKSVELVIEKAKGGPVGRDKYCHPLGIDEPV